MEGLLEEMNRNRELQKMYEEIGMPGMFGLSVLKAKLGQAERAVASGDVVAMLKAYKDLQESK